MIENFIVKSKNSSSVICILFCYNIVNLFQEAYQTAGGDTNRYCQAFNSYIVIKLRFLMQFVLL